MLYNRFLNLTLTKHQIIRCNTQSNPKAQTKCIDQPRLLASAILRHNKISLQEDMGWDQTQLVLMAILKDKSPFLLYLIHHKVCQLLHKWPIFLKQIQEILVLLKMKHQIKWYKNLMEWWDIWVELAWLVHNQVLTLWKVWDKKRLTIYNNSQWEVHPNLKLANYTQEFPLTFHKLQ